MNSKSLFLAAFVVILFSANILAQGINWGLRLDAYMAKTVWVDRKTGAQDKEFYYPWFFTTPQVVLNIYPVKQFGAEFRAGYEIYPTGFAGGEYTLLAKTYFYQPLYLLAGVCFKNIIDSDGGRFSYIGAARFGMLTAGIGLQYSRHFSAELIYLHGNKRHLGYSGIYEYYPYTVQDKYLYYVLKFSIGWQWSIYDF